MGEFGLDRMSEILKNSVNGDVVSLRRDQMVLRADDSGEQ